jgi:hypothetical protein
MRTHYRLMPPLFVAAEQAIERGRGVAAIEPICRRMIPRSDAPSRVGAERAGQNDVGAPRPEVRRSADRERSLGLEADPMWCNFAPRW